MTPIERSQLQEVNSRVNAIPYSVMPGKAEPPDWWTDEPIEGNSWVCRDYTLMKADQLKALGWSESSLSEVICWTESIPPRECHAVLAVKVAGGEIWVLDSRVEEIYSASAPVFDYLWIEQQIAGTTDFRSATGGLV